MNISSRTVLLLAALCPSISISQNLPPEYTFSWAWGALGKPLGSGMLAHHDFDGDGVSEIVLTAGDPTRWGPPGAVFVLEPNLEQYRCWKELPEPFLEGIIWNVDSDPESEIVLVGANRIEVLDWRSCELKTTIEFSSPVDAAAFGDLDGSGSLDIAFSRNGDLHVGPWNDPETTEVRHGFGGDRIQISPVDDVPGDDILVFSSVLRLHHGLDLATIAEFSPRPDMATTGQLVPGGSHEVVIGTAWKDGITAYSLDDGSVLFNRPIFNLDSINVQDIDGNGTAEVIYGDAQWGSVFVLDADGEVLHEIENPENGTTNVLVADLYSDGRPEMLWGTGEGNSGADHLFIGDLFSEKVIRRTASFNGPFLIAGIDDIDLDGNDELVGLMDSSAASWGAPLIISIDSGSGAVESLKVLYPNFYPEWVAIAFGDIDNNGSKELCFAQSRFSNNIRCILPTDQSSVLEISAPGDISNIALVDLNEDDRPEIISTHYDEIRAFDASSGNLLWVSEKLPFSGQGSTLGYMNDALLYAGGGPFVRLDPANGKILSIDQSTNIGIFAVFNDRLAIWQIGSGLTYYDELTQSVEEMIYPTESSIRRLNSSPDTNSLVFSLGPSLEPVDTIVISPVTGNSPLQLGRKFFHSLLITDHGTVFGFGRFGMKSFQPEELIFSDDFDGP